MTRNILQSGFAFAAAAVMLSLISAPAKASVDFSAASGALAAKVSFDVAPGGNLMVVLTNTAATAGADPADILTAVLFKGLDGLTPVAAFLQSGNDVINMGGNYAAYQSALPTIANPLVSPNPPQVPNVGGEWGYGPAQSGTLPNGATSGISSSGLGGWFGDNNFNGPDLSNPAALDGVQYGVAPSSQTDGSGNGGIKTSPMIRNAVTFVLSGYTGGDAGLTSISNVSFQYGTAQNEPNLVVSGPPVCSNGNPFPYCNQQQVDTPEPMSIAVMSVGLLGLGMVRRRRRRAA